MNSFNQTNPKKFARSVSIIGVGCTPFMETLNDPETEGYTEGDLFGYAALSAMEDAGISPKDVEFYFHGEASPLNGSNYLTPNMQVAEWFGMRGKASLHHSEACCTGYLALDQAVQAVASGKYDVVLSGCVEFGDALATEGKPAHIRHKFSFDEFQRSTQWLVDNAYSRHLLSNLGHDNSAAWYMEKAGLTPKQLDDALCMLAVNARHNAMNNPLAIDHQLYEDLAKEAGYENVLDYMESSNNPRVGNYMRISGLEHKCDGAAAVVVCATDLAEKISKKKPILVLGVGNSALEASNPFLEVYGTQEAARQVYNVTGVKPDEIDLMYVNDFIISSQLISAEIAGYIPEGQAWKYVMDGRTNIDGDKSINPNGGRTAFGHAHAASGLADVYDAVKQMRGEAVNPIKKLPKTTFLRGFGGGQNLCNIILRTKD